MALDTPYAGPQSRRSLLSQAIWVATGSAVLLGAGEKATADLYYTKEEPLQGQTFKSEREALVQTNVDGVKAAANALKEFDFFVTDKDYISLRAALRRPPFSGVRIESRAILGYMTGDAQRQAEKQYSSFIQSVERLDRLAGLGARDGKGLGSKDYAELTSVYQAAIRNADSFVQAIEQ